MQWRLIANVVADFDPSSAIGDPVIADCFYGGTLRVGGDWAASTTPPCTGARTIGPIQPRLPVTTRLNERCDKPARSLRRTRTDWGDTANGRRRYRPIATRAVGHNAGAIIEPGESSIELALARPERGRADLHERFAAGSDTRARSTAFDTSERVHRLAAAPSHSAREPDGNVGITAGRGSAAIGQLMSA
jgi:hypothetical protein